MKSAKTGKTALMRKEGRGLLHAIALGAVLCLSVSHAAAGGAPKEHIVRMVTDYKNLRMAFSPKTIIIQPGDTVTWVNDVAEEHNVVSYPDGYPKGAKLLSSPNLTKKNERWSHRFLVEGTYEYHCIPHLPLGMHGTVIVSRPSTVDEFHIPSVDEMRRYAKRLREYFKDDEFTFRPRNERNHVSKDKE